MKDFLRPLIKPEPGDVLDETRNVIGQHGGAVLYTLGERQGLDIFKKTPDQAPLYILAKDLVKNTLTVGPKKI